MSESNPRVPFLTYPGMANTIGKLITVMADHPEKIDTTHPGILWDVFNTNNQLINASEHDFAQAIECAQLFSRQVVEIRRLPEYER